MEINVMPHTARFIRCGL